MKLLRKLLLKLAMYDMIWSLPLAMFVFWLIGSLFQSFFGLAAGAYDIAFFQPIFLSLGIVIAASNFAALGLWFGFRGLFRFLYGTMDENGKYINPSKETWANLTAWQKFILAFSVSFSYFWAVVLVYLHLV